MTTASSRPSQWGLVTGGERAASCPPALAGWITREPKMISDVLSVAVSAIREYQEEFPQCYDGLRERIGPVVEAMEDLLKFLDFEDIYVPK